MDNLPADLLKSSGDFGKKSILLLCTKVWSTCSWPKEWRQQEFVLLPKSGDSKMCSNYRTIALISHISKILLYIILNRLKVKMEFEVAEEQAGFREGRGTADMLCALQALIEKVHECTSVEHSLEGYIVFIDYSKAFDNVSHPKLFDIMKEMGFPLHLVNLIAGLYCDQEALIRWNREHTEPFKICKGVRQGCILSPHLFSTYTEKIMRDANVEDFGIKVGGRLVSNLRYADDTALCADNHEDICMLLNRINEEGKTKNMKLNAKKTKVMYIGRGQYKDIEVDGEILERVHDFIYLGSTKTENGDCKPDIVRRIAMGKSKMVDLKNIWKDKDLSHELKLKIMKVLVWTVMTYGAEGWTLRSEEMKRIQAAEMWCYRRLLNVTYKDRRTNVSILEDLNTNRQLYGIVVKRKMSYFGHMSRKKNLNLTKTIVQGKPEGKRGKGRPRTAYIDNIKQWTGLSAHRAFQATHDRESWRQTTRKAVQAANTLMDEAAKK